jgi:hypothetical protein
MSGYRHRLQKEWEELSTAEPTACTKAVWLPGSCPFAAQRRKPAGSLRSIAEQRALADMARAGWRPELSDAPFQEFTSTIPGLSACLLVMSVNNDTDPPTGAAKPS